MGISRVLGLCAALLFASSVSASTINVGPSNYQNYGPSGAHTTGGVQSTFGQQVRLPPTISGPTRLLPVSRNAVIPYGSIANGLKNFTRINPASLAASAAVTGLFLAVDWAFDESAGQWGKEGYEEVPTEDPFYQWEYSLGGIRGSNPVDACVNGIYAFPPDPTSYTFTGTATIQPSGQNYFNCIGDGVYPNGSPMKFQSGSVSRVGNECPPGSSWVESLNACGTYTIIDLDPSDWTHLEGTLPSANPQQVANAAGDTQRLIGNPLPGYSDLTMTGPVSVSGPTTTSTSTDPVTGDTVVTTTNTTTNINYGDTTITTTNTTTTTTHQNGQETSTTVTTETPGELPVDGGGVPPAGEWPGFCDWATVVCDWLNWTQEEPPPDVDLPQVIDDDFFNEKTISFGAKSCPPDHEINLAPFLTTSVGVSFQPLCDFAGLIYYMVMAASYIIAAYISIGVARNG